MKREREENKSEKRTEMIKKSEGKRRRSKKEKRK